MPPSGVPFAGAVCPTRQKRDKVVLRLPYARYARHIHEHKSGCGRIFSA
jgi:hypothetical protein